MVRLPAEQSRYEEAGFDAFVPKPFRFEEVVKCLEKQLGVRFEFESAPASASSASSASHAHAHAIDPKPTASERAKESQSAIDGDPLVDAQRLHELFGGDHDRRRRYLESYLRHTTEQLDQLCDAVKSGHASEVELIAHRCKGASGNLGITAMAQAMEKLEAAAVAKELGDGARLLAETQETFARVQQNLQQS